MEMMRFILFLVDECINSFLLLLVVEGGWVALTEDSDRGMSARAVTWRGRGGRGPSGLLSTGTVGGAGCVWKEEGVSDGGESKATILPREARSNVMGHECGAAAERDLRRGEKLWNTF